MDVVAELELARESHRRHAWAEGYARFTAVDQAAQLDAEDVERLAESAELTGRDDEAVRLLLRAYQGYVDAGVADGAARCGWWLYHAFRMRVRLARPGGIVVLEDPDWESWHFNPPAPALEQLIALIREAFRRWGDPEAGRKQLHLFRSFGIEATTRAEVLALPPGHPYLRLPLQMSTSLTPRLTSFTDADKLQQLQQEGKTELEEPGRWGTTFTLLQSWGHVPQ